MTWTQAKGKCAAMSGELLAIHSPEEQNFVTSLIADKPMPYIGLTMNNTLTGKPENGYESRVIALIRLFVSDQKV